MPKYYCKAPGMLLDRLHEEGHSVANVADIIGLTPEEFSSFIFGGVAITEEQKQKLESELFIRIDCSRLMFTKKEEVL